MGAWPAPFGPHLSKPSPAMLWASDPVRFRPTPWRRLPLAVAELSLRPPLPMASAASRPALPASRNRFRPFRLPAPPFGQLRDGPVRRGLGDGRSWPCSQDPFRRPPPGGSVTGGRKGRPLLPTAAAPCGWACDPQPARWAFRTVRSPGAAASSASSVRGFHCGTGKPSRHGHVRVFRSCRSCTTGSNAHKFTLKTEISLILFAAFLFASDALRLRLRGESIKRARAHLSTGRKLRGG